MFNCVNKTREILLIPRNRSICTKRLHRLLGQDIMHMLITYKLKEIFLSGFLSRRIVLTLTLILPMYWKYSRTAVVNRTAVLAVEVDWLKSIKANLVVRSLPKHAPLMADQFDEVREGVVISLQVSMLVRVVENCELLDLYPSRRKLFERSSFYPKQVSDIVPIACQAAAQAGIPSVCISNFRYIICFRLLITMLCLPFNVVQVIFGAIALMQFYGVWLWMSPVNEHYY